MEKEKIKGLAAINIAAVIFGSAALYGKLNVSPVWIVCLRAFFAAATLSIFAVARKELVSIVNSRKFVFGTGVILALHWLTFFFSVQLAGIAIATLTFAAFPLFTLIIETARVKRKPKPLEIAACLMIIFAVSLLIKADSVSQNYLIGTLLGISSAVLFAFFGVMSKKLTSVLPTLTVSFYQNVTVFIVLLAFLPFSSPFANDLREWTFLAVLGILTTAIMHQLYFYALKRLSASTCSGFIALEPVYAILFAGLFFGEPVTVVVVISGLLILIASFLMTKS
jgi:drug/metabolite transporter (DMT)-like permease